MGGSVGAHGVVLRTSALLLVGLLRRLAACGRLVLQTPLRGGELLGTLGRRLALRPLGRGLASLHGDSLRVGLGTSTVLSVAAGRVRPAGREGASPSATRAGRRSGGTSSGGPPDRAPTAAGSYGRSCGAWMLLLHVARSVAR